MVIESLSPIPVNSSSAATPVTISGVTRGSSVTAPMTRPRRERTRSRPSASIVPRTSEPSVARVAILRLATSESSSALSCTSASYHCMLKPENVDSDFLSLKLKRATARIGR